ncbi:DUF6417 family protein [Streptomyces sp. NPDC001910]|uniref:DUF6417 family protein n=1 Tax=Streptomyces sp. NPDC001910 TaxID=3154403 RepID=UPI0033228212
MNDYEQFDLDEVAFASMEDTAERLALLTLEEAHDLLRLLLMVAEKSEDPLAGEAERLVREIAARIPSEN